MKRLNILTEGQTEEKFAREILAPHLALFGLDVSVRLLITGKTRQYQVGGMRQSKLHKGGLLNFAQVKQDLVRWRNQESGAFLTTMFDLYALPDDFPEFTQNITLEPIKRVQKLEQAFAKEVALQNFIPYIQLHEFEALLFVDVDILNEYVTMDFESPSKTLHSLQAVIQQFENPELINDSPHTAPSKRLESIFGKQFNKVEHGFVVASEIGLEKIRAKCPHFNEWVTKLENI